MSDDQLVSYVVVLRNGPLSPAEDIETAIVAAARAQALGRSVLRIEQGGEVILVGEALEGSVKAAGIAHTRMKIALSFLSTPCLLRSYFSLDSALHAALNSREGAWGWSRLAVRGHREHRRMQKKRPVGNSFNTQRQGVVAPRQRYESGEPGNGNSCPVTS